MAATGGPSTTFQRRLVRDGLQTAWGFRLQGGKDFNQPLTVQRVFTGSPAEGELQRGDVVIAINNRDTNTLVHKEALDIIKRSGGELLLSVQRGPNRYQAPNQPTTPQVAYQPQHNSGANMAYSHHPQYQHQHSAPAHHNFTPNYAASSQPYSAPQQHVYNLPHHQQSASSPTMQGGYRPVQFSTSGPVPVSPTKTAQFGVHYGPPQQSRNANQPMINRVQQSLENVTYARPGDEDYDPDYDYRTVNQRKAAFIQDNQQQRRQQPQSRGKKWQAPPSSGGMQFGWGPSVRPDPNYRPGPPTHEGTTDFPSQQAIKQVRQERPAPRQRPVSASNLAPLDDDTPPAWRGSLKKAGSTTPSGTYKTVQFDPTHQPAQQQVRIQQPQANINQGPQVVHLQYNSPMGLYSKGSADDALRGQTAGRPGQGTLMITGGDGKQEIDWKKSHVYQMIHGSEQGGPKAARHQDFGNEEIQYEGFQDQNRQSRSFQMLANQVEGEEPQEGPGTSDF